MPIYQVIPTVLPPSDEPSPPVTNIPVTTPTPEELRQVFQESVRSTAFCLQLSKRMCAALLASLRFEEQPSEAWATLRAVFMGQRSTGRALQERGLVEGRSLTRAGRIVAQLVELAGFSIADFDPLIARQVGISDDPPPADSVSVFREYVTSTAFVIMLSQRMVETLGAMRGGERHKLNDYPHFLSTIRALQARGLTWWDEAEDRMKGSPHKLTEAGKLVAELLGLMEEAVEPVSAIASGFAETVRQAGGVATVEEVSVDE